jgi:glycosyltransferase involved in cell wall biosynthesis
MRAAMKQRHARNSSVATPILFHESYFDSFYGAQKGLHTLLQYMDKKRFVPLVVCPGEGVFAERIRALGVEVLIVPLPPALMVFGGSLLRQSLLRKAWDFSKLLPQVMELAGLIKRRQVRLMHCNTPRSVLSSGWAAKLAGIPLVWHLKAEDFLGFVDQFAYMISDRIITISEDVERAAKLRFPRWKHKIVTVRDGIPLERFQTAVPGLAGVRRQFGFQEEHVVVGTVGSLVPRKGFEMFIEMAKTVAAECPTARFLVVGDVLRESERPYKQHLLDLGRDLVESGRLVFAGWREDMPAVYAAMDIFTLCSSSEGLGLVVIEAMASGRPTVRTMAAGANDTVVHGETGYLVSIDNTAALSAAVKELVVASGLRSRMGTAARERAFSVFPAEKMARDVERVFEECLSTGPNGPGLERSTKLPSSSISTGS